MRAEPSGITLKEQDAAIVKGMIARGDRQHDIAAWFGVNGGRIAEISTGATFPDVPVSTNELPPPGPYLSGKGVSKAKDELLDIREALAKLVARVDEQIKRLD